MGIGVRAFRDCSKLTSVSFPGTLESIGDNAFDGSGLGGALDLSGTKVTEIGIGAFQECSKLTSVSFPGTLESIGSWVFFGCSGLGGALDLSKTKVKTIGYHAFRDCSKLTSVSFPGTLVSIGYAAFYGCSGLLCADGNSSPAYTSQFVNPGMGTANLPTCTWAPQCQVDVKIPEWITAIPDEAFQGCKKLKSVPFPTTLVSIGHRAFN